MTFSPRHVVALVACIAAMSILAPVGVMAATGQLVNIVDPSKADRKVRVGSAGTLRVETRPGVPKDARNVVHLDIQNLSPRELLSVTGPTRIALSELTLGVHNVGSPVVEPTVMDLTAYVRDSGTNPCGGSGWTKTVLRRITVSTDTTEQISFDGPPLMVPAAPDGKRQCLAVSLDQWVGQTKVDVGATVFPYTP